MSVRPPRRPDQPVRFSCRTPNVSGGLAPLGFLHFQEEVEFFGREVIPPARDLEARRSVHAAA